MGNWVELHQNEKPFLVNLDNVSAIISAKRFDNDSPMTAISYNDGENGYCDETYDQIKKMFSYFVP